MVSDHDALLARSDGASKRPQWPADKLHVQKMTEASEKILRTPPDERNRAVSRLTPSSRREHKGELQSKRADLRTRLRQDYGGQKQIEPCLFFSWKNSP